MLTLEIVKHVYGNLGLFDKKNKFHSIIEDKFLLNKKISLLDEFEQTIENKIWAAQLTFTDKKIRLMVANCSVTDSPEYALIISLDDSPSFGCFLNDEGTEAMISYFINHHWMKSSVQLQANFLSGMEQLKDTHGEWIKCKYYEDLYSSLTLFIQHCDEVIDAG